MAGALVAWLEVRARHKISAASLSPKWQPYIYVRMASLTEFRLDETFALLNRTPATLNVLLRGLPDIWVHRNEGEGTWNAFDIVGHLIFGERTDWVPRVRIILESGEGRAI